MRLPIRTRLTLVFAGMSLVVLGVAGSALLIEFRAELDRTIDQSLRSRAASIGADPPVGIAAIPEGDEVFAQLVRSDGSVESSANLPTEPMFPPSVLRSFDRPTFFDRVVRTIEERVPSRLFAVPSDSGSFLVVGMDVEDQDEAVERLTVLVAVGGPIVLVVLSSLGWILAGAALRPVEGLRSEAAAISTSEPDRLCRCQKPATSSSVSRRR